MIKIPRVIVVTGTPGVGKTMVSKALTEKLGGLYINITEFVKRKNFILGVDSKRNTIVADLNKISDMINQIIKNVSLDVVVDGHYASDVVSSDVVSYAFVLRLDPAVLEDRLRARGYKENKISENVASEILDVCLVDTIKEYGFKRVDEINTSKMSVEDVVKEIFKVLNGQKKCRVGIVNWLDKLEKDGRLDRFLTIIDKYCKVEKSL